MIKLDETELDNRSFFIKSVLFYVDKMIEDGDI